jgi:hypothetical protein
MSQTFDSAKIWSTENKIRNGSESYATGGSFKSTASTNWQWSPAYQGYFDKLRELISSCQYGAMKDELLLDKIIYSSKDENVRRILWEDRDITLTQAINKCNAREITENQLKSIRPNEQDLARCNIELW